MLEEKKYKDKSKLLAKVKAGNRQLLRKLYEDYREMFEKWAKKHYQCDDELIVEAYQTAFIAFYYNIKGGRLKTLNSSIKTYLFAIGKNTLRELLKDKHQHMLPLETDRYEELDTTLLDRYKDEANKSLVSELLRKIGDPCKTVLELYYLKEYSMESIALRMGYKSEQIAAKRKFICLQQLRKLMKERSTN